MKRIWRVVKRGLWIGLAVAGGLVLLLVIGIGVKCGALVAVPPSQEVDTDRSKAVEGHRQQISAVLSGHRRREEQTYLTLPEWYIVYSADAYATFIATQPPSQFPYFQAIGQYWQTYENVCAATRGRYAFNTGYHLSLAIIGGSFTLENLVKGLYETTLGRLTEWLSSPALTEEDAYARQVANAYGTFIHTTPWYAFHFGTALTDLWKTTRLWGPNGLRKWERKLALSLEYGGKALYGWVIRQGTQATYAPEELRIRVWANGISPEVLKREPQLQMVTVIEAHNAIVSLPRYEAFTRLVPRLVAQGVQFLEMAGNDDLLLTAIAPRQWTYDLQDGHALFDMPILAQPGLKRVAVQVPVPALHRVLIALASRAITVEHLYDY